MTAPLMSLPCLSRQAHCSCSHPQPPDHHAPNNHLHSAPPPHSSVLHRAMPRPLPLHICHISTRPHPSLLHLALPFSLSCPGTFCFIMHALFYPLLPFSDFFCSASLHPVPSLSDPQFPSHPILLHITRLGSILLFLLHIFPVHLQTCSTLVALHTAAIHIAPPSSTPRLHIPTFHLIFSAPLHHFEGLSQKKQ